MLFDNIDQRPSEELEANLIANVAAIYQNDICRIVRPALTLLPMRERTYSQQGWIQTRLMQWGELRIRPIDFATILQRRCRSWSSSGRDVGDAARPMISRITALVEAWTGGSREKRATTDSGPQARHPRVRDLDLLDIIQERHPYDIAGRLKEFSECCNSPLLQRSLSQGRLEDDSKDVWTTDRSFEFYVRVFLLGGKSWFSEADNRIVNLFDHAHSKHPLNASIRGWLLLFFQDAVCMPRIEVETLYEACGVTNDIVSSAIDALTRWGILRYESKSAKTIRISKWGSFFRNYIAFDLPYASTVWWYTPVTPEFSLGRPFVPAAGELRDLASRFLRWLRFEDRLARSYLTCSPPGDTNIFEISNFRILYSLRRIERALRSRRRVPL